MPTQYIDFTTKPNFATIWDDKASAPADAIPVQSEMLQMIVTAPARFEIQHTGRQSYTIADTVEGWEVCNIVDHSDLTPETCQSIAIAVCHALNNSVLSMQIDFECEPDIDD